MDIYSKPVSIFSNKHPWRLFKFEVLRLQHLFQNKKNHLYETSEPCHGLDDDMQVDHSDITVSTQK